jgi:hypothetical protein
MGTREGQRPRAESPLCWALRPSLNSTRCSKVFPRRKTGRRAGYSIGCRRISARGSSPRELETACLVREGRFRLGRILPEYFASSQDAICRLTTQNKHNLYIGAPLRPVRKLSSSTACSRRQNLSAWLWPQCGSPSRKGGMLFENSTSTERLRYERADSGACLAHSNRHLPIRNARNTMKTNDGHPV